MRIAPAMLALVLLGACSRQPDSSADSALAAEIQRIRAIDNHAHPVRNVLKGPPDREFDALPVDNMEPASDPVGLRPDALGIRAADQALYGTTARKAQIQREKGDAYPAWVLDQAGIDIMLA